MALARMETYGSMSCVRASRPVEAVISGGRTRVSSGSTTAIRGNMCGLRRLAFTRCFGEASTELRVTSEPEPAVVGTAMKGADGHVRGRPWPTTSR